MASESNSQGSTELLSGSRVGSFAQYGSGGGHFKTVATGTWTMADQGEARLLEATGSPIAKRRLLSIDGHDTPKRRHISSSTSSSSTFANLEITKPTLLNQGNTDIKTYVPSSILSQTVNQISSQKIGTLSSQTLADPESLITHVYGGRNNAPPRPQQKTTMEHLTPRLTEPSQSSAWRMGEVSIAGDFAEPSASADPAEQHGWQEKDGTVQPIVHDDEYPIDEDDEEEMIRLLSEAKTVSKPQFPPSSVADAWDHDSRTVEDYDPTLQHSSIQSTPNSGIGVQLIKDHGQTEEDLLDDDVDWDAIFTITNNIPKDDSLVGDREWEQRRKEAAANDEMGERSTESLPEFPQAGQLRPFTRPPFPAKIRDRPSVPGFSSRTILRVCFRVEDLIQEATHCYHQDQEAVFELYARVTYSSREPLAKKQYFQFRDLFEDKQPFPSGTLSG